MHDHGGQAVAKGRIGQQGVAQPLVNFVQLFQALDDRAVAAVGQRAPRADPGTRNRAGDDPGKIVAGRAKVADELPNGIGRGVDGDRAGDLRHLVAGLYPVLILDPVGAGGRLPICIHPDGRAGDARTAGIRLY